MTPAHNKPEVLVVGSSNTDLVVRVPNLPGPGQTVLGHGFFKAAGGKGANQAVAAARAGASVTFVGCVGDDDFGRDALAGLAREGIDVTRVRIDPAQPSGVALIAVDGSGENSISVAAGANASLMPEHLESARDAFDRADVCLVQLETPLDTVTRAAELASSAGAHVILNPAPAQALPAGLLCYVSTIVPNETEAELLTGIRPQSDTQAGTAAAALLGQGVARAILTLGERGAVLATAGGIESVAPPGVQVVDTTGAGDAFCGALATALGKGWPASRAVAFACSAAACAVTRSGAQPSMPLLEEIEDTLHKYYYNQ